MKSFSEVKETFSSINHNYRSLCASVMGLNFFKFVVLITFYPMAVYNFKNNVRNQRILIANILGYEENRRISLIPLAYILFQALDHTLCHAKHDNSRLWRSLGGYHLTPNGEK